MNFWEVLDKLKSNRWCWNLSYYDGKYRFTVWKSYDFVRTIKPIEAEGDSEEEVVMAVWEKAYATK